MLFRFLKAYSMTEYTGVPVEFMLGCSLRTIIGGTAIPIKDCVSIRESPKP